MPKCIIIKDPNRKSETAPFTPLEIRQLRNCIKDCYASINSYYSNNEESNKITTKTLQQILTINPGDFIYLQVNNLIMAKGIAKKVPSSNIYNSIIKENLNSIVNNDSNYNKKAQMRIDSCITRLNSNGTNNKRANWIMLFDDAPCFLHSRPKQNNWGQFIFVENWIDLKTPIRADNSLFKQNNTDCPIRDLINNLS